MKEGPYPVPTEPPPAVPDGYVAEWSEAGGWLILPASREDRLALARRAYQQLAARVDREPAAKRGGAE